MTKVVDNSVKFVIDAVDDASKTLTRIRGNIDRMVRGVRASFAGLGRVFASVWQYLRWIGLAAAGVAAAGLYKFARSAVMATVQAETLRARLETLFGAKTATGAWKWAQDFAKSTPFELNEIVDAVARLKAYSIDPFSTLRTIGDFAASMGRPILDAVEAVADATMGEWERMKEFGIKRDTLEKWMSSRGMASAFSKTGAITDAAGAQAGLFAMMGERSAGGMARMMDTIAGKWANLQDAMWTFFSSIGARLADPLKRALSFVTAIVEKLSKPVGEGIGKWMDSLFAPGNIERVMTLLAQVYVFLRYLPQAMVEFGRIAHKVLYQVGDTLIRLAEAFANTFFDIGNIFATVLNLQIKAMNLWARGVYEAIRTVVNAVPFGPNIAPWSDDRAMPTLQTHPHVDFTQQRVWWRDAMQNGFGGLTRDHGAEVDQVKNWLMSVWQGMGTDSAGVKSPLQRIAENTGRMVDQNDALLDRIYGGGDRMRLLASRLAFGGYGGGANVTININGAGSGGPQIADEVARRLGTQLAVRPRLGLGVA